SLNTALPDPIQRNLLQQFIDLRAVSGSSKAFCSIGMDGSEEEALVCLFEMGWVTHVSENQKSSAAEKSKDMWQLTSKPLELIKVQFALGCPFSVFQRRSGVALKDATIFELMIQLQ
ncbi:unnamed protein product, partial [Effrenium voratum]